MTQCDAELAGYGGLESDTQWATAADVWRSAGQPYDVAYALFRQAEALTAVRRRKEAAERLDQAESLLVNLGAMPLLQRVRRLRAAGALGEAPVDQRPDAMAGRDRLGELGVTGRERQVLELLAQGKTNRQIGRVLGTTERTAGTHVSNLLRKLGVSSRTEAVFVAHRLR